MNRAPAVNLTSKEEAQIRGEINRGVPHEEICRKWNIKIPRLRKINCGPLKKMGFAIEASLRG